VGVELGLSHERNRPRVFQKRILRRVFGAKNEVTGGWRKFQNEIHNLYSSPNVIRVMKSMRLRWVGHVARMGDEKCMQNFGRKT
jgi:hypothetical protein